MVEYLWRHGTVFDLFLSLDVLHDPAKYGLRGSWAAGVRSRIPAVERTALQAVMKSYIWAFPWAATLPEPCDGRAALDALAQIPASERFTTLASYYMDGRIHAVLIDVAGRKGWDNSNKEALTAAYCTRKTAHPLSKLPSDQDLTQMLTVWSDVAGYGEAWLAALNAYYKAFFAEEEARIQPSLETAVSHAQSLAKAMPLPELLEKLSQGLLFTDVADIQKIIMIPSFWVTPLSVFTPVRLDGPGQWAFMFGARPSAMSLVPGDVVPDALFQSLKALADPTRLRILRYLSTEELTPAELARRLRLRPPTVIHHLHALRLARLVHLTISSGGKRYAVRPEAVDATSALLSTYLKGEMRQMSGNFDHNLLQPEVSP
ncbi:MAG: ArsR/SmtB family transcription factor [Anaerolineae bacterium]